MKKIRRFTAVLASAALISASTLTSAAMSTSAEQSAHERAAEITASMTTKQKIAQMIMLDVRNWREDANSDYEGVTSLNDFLKQELKDYSYNGMILCEPNIIGTEQSARLVNEIQDTAMQSELGLPMLLSADQEGGSIIRIGTGTDTCGNMALGAAADPKYAYENASIIGSELAAIGINDDLAPVLDVNCNPANPVIGIRSFSSDPELVSSMGVEYIKGLADAGVCSTAKHFPGHGDTSVDSHTGLPLIDKSYDELKEMELVPFKAAIDAGVDMIMTAHIQFPQIETNTYTSISTGEQVYLPATLSKTILTDILRGDMGFDGIIITDAMLMDAVKNNIDRIDAAVLAINAGVDIILSPVDTTSEEGFEDLHKYIDDVEAAVDNGRIDMSTIDESVTRIIELKLEKKLADYDKDIEHKVANALSVVGSKEHHDKELEITNKAITLVKNDDDTLPLNMNENDTAAFFYWNPLVENSVIYAANMLKNEGIIPESTKIETGSFKNNNASDFTDIVDRSSVVVVLVESWSESALDPNGPDGSDIKFFNEITQIAHSKGKKVIAVSLVLPYDVAAMGGADAVLAAYSAMKMKEIPTEFNGETQNYGPNIISAILTIFGANNPSGKLPVDVYKLDENSRFTSDILYPLGYGLSYKEEEQEETSEETSSETNASETNASVSTSVSSKAESKSVSSSGNSGNKNADAPKTGSAGAGTPIAMLCVAVAAAFIIRKSEH